jgi:uncharacterized protein (UPF0335 family)
MTSHKIQELIDEHKENINENIYLELCNKLMQINKEEQKEKEEQKVFKITYLEPYIKKTDFNEFEIDMKRKQLYVPLTKLEHKEIKNRLDERGHFTAHIIRHKMDENVKIDWTHTKTKFNKIAYHHRDREECNIECGSEYCDCGLMTNCTHFKVKVWREIVKIQKYDNPEL